LSSSCAIERHLRLPRRSTPRLQPLPTRSCRQSRFWATRQLRSGDLCVSLPSEVCAQGLRDLQNEWIGGLAPRAVVSRRTYGVLMHGVAVKGFDVSDPATRASLIRQNCQVHDLEILRLTWLTNPAITKKTVSSVVMEIVNPRTANAIIDSGIYWNKQHLAVERYDPACRLRQCFKCQQFGHIGPQCHSKERCGWCAGPHNSRSCSHNKDDTKVCCSNCRSKHAAWSKGCEIRQKEERKVNSCRVARERYHLVPTVATPIPSLRPTHIHVQSQAPSTTQKRARTDGAVHPDRQRTVEQAQRRLRAIEDARERGDTYVELNDTAMSE
jgi:hypothetical protein